MKNLDLIGKELFDKVRGRFPGVTIGNAGGEVISDPREARFFDFEYNKSSNVSISLSEDDGVVVTFSKDIVDGQEDSSSKDWYNFLKELRVFAKKRMLKFETRDIAKSNLTKRDYGYLAGQNAGEEKMTESKLYGTSRLSYQDVDSARLVIKHTESINQEVATARTQKIGKIYIESADGERFMYPYKHLSGARAMARHVAEGGKPFDDFGKHITGLSEELAKLRKFKTYMGRSAVMAESLSEYMDVVKERIATVKKTVESLQKPKMYKEAFGSFETPVFEDVPDDVKENWIDQLTIKQFNEELADVFPYIYKLVSEATKAKELGPDDLVDESGLQYYTGKKKYGKEGMAALAKAGREGASEEELGAIKDKYKKTKEEFELEAAFEATLGQFSDHEVCEECGNPSWTILGMTEEEIEEGERHGNSKIYDKCWKGYRKVPGKKAGEEGSCKKVESEDSKHAEPEDPNSVYARLMGDISEIQNGALDGNDMADDIADELGDYLRNGDAPEGSHYEEAISIVMDALHDGPEAQAEAAEEAISLLHMEEEKARGNPNYEGNAYANAVRQAKKDGKKKGDKIQGPDGDEITLEKEQKTPLGEFILSYYDRETGEFPKGETAVLTMVEKDYGEQFIEPAKAFIERVNQTFVEYKQKEQIEDPEFSRMRELAGLR